MIAERVRRLSTWLSVLHWVVVLLAVFAFWRGASEHGEHVNRAFAVKDQGAYLNLGARIARTHRLEVDGARPPLYPMLIAFANDRDDDRAAFFVRARRLTTGVATVAWLAFLFVLRRFLTPATALATWLATGFTLWMFYAPYVKAEALFYVLSSAAFILMLAELRRPSTKGAVILGAVAGLAHLFKASMAPALWLFVAVQVLAAVVYFVRHRTRPRAARKPLRRVRSTALTAGVFLLVLAPYLVENKRVFGAFFYNVNSDFYVWYDSWAQSGKGTRGHGDRKGFPSLPPEKLPSAAKYLRTHSGAQIWGRVERGAEGLALHAADGPGFLALTLLALAAGGVAVIGSRELRRSLVRDWQIPLFASGYFAGYLLLDFWFFAINPGLRFVAALVAPALFVGGWLADRATRRRSRWVTLAYPLLLVAALVIHAPLIAESVRTWSQAGW